VDPEYGRLFAQEYEYVLRACVLLAAGDRGLAEDAAVDAFISSYRPWRRGRVDNFRSYVRLAATRRVAHLARKRPLVPDHLPDRPASDDVEASALTGSQLTRILAGTPFRERQVLVLRHYYDMTEVDTAAALHMPLGTVKTLNRRALQRLAVDRRLTTHPIEEL
jgi:RNA polymerase sigma factor (sigma-70 family)